MRDPRKEPTFTPARALLATVLGLLGLFPASHAGAHDGGAGAGLIAFARHCGTGCSDLFVVRADGTGLRRLTDTRNNFDPAWSPDGRRLVFASDRAGGSGAPELYVVDADGSKVTRLTHTIHAPDNYRSSYAPAWSPDGSRIAFIRTVVRRDAATGELETSEDLYVMDVPAGPTRRLTYTRERETDPAWSPDGRSLVFARDGVLHIVSSSGGRARKLVDGFAAVWSPDGTRIAFTGPNGGIFLVDAGGKGVTRVPGTRGSDSYPSWSPDGTRLVVMGDGDLQVLGLDGARTRLTRAPGLTSDLSPAWRP